MKTTRISTSYYKVCDLFVDDVKIIRLFSEFSKKYDWFLEINGYAEDTFSSKKEAMLAVAELMINKTIK